MLKNVILPAGLLAGTIIGAGIFALPFVFEKAGILTGLFYLVIFGVVFTLIHLMYAEVILKTGSNHRFPGYARTYLGNFGFWSTILTTVIGMVITLTIYLILSVSFINLIEPISFNAFGFFNLLFFWLLGSAAIFLEIRRLALLESLITGGIIVIILIIAGYGLNFLDKINTTSIFNIQNIFLPYGAVLFALAGRTAVPAVINYFQKTNQSLSGVKKPLILGTLAPALVYLLFVFGILGLSGTVSEDAVSGLIGHVPNLILKLIGIFGLISLWSSYIVIGLDVKNTMRYDLKFPKILAGLTVIFSPLILFLLGFQNFLVMIGLVGGIFIALEGIFIVLMWRKSRKTKPESIIFKKLNPFVVYALIIVFIGGIIYEIIH